MSIFKESVILVTGASGNLGTAVAKRFADEGAHLILVDRSANKLQEIFADLDQARHMFIAGIDVTSEDSIDSMLSQALTRFGRIDVLVNTVGGFHAGTAVHETDTKTWNFMQTLNASSAFLLSRAIVPTMLEQGSGKIIHIAAAPGLKAGKGNAAYSASKSAVIRLTEGLAADYKTKGINANCILPSIIDTPQNREAMPDADFSKWVTPESIAQVIAFLASEAARDIHGVALPVSGKS